MAHNTEKNNKRNQRGLLLIETSMVLALSAIVVSGVMYYYQAASDNNKTQSTVSEVMSIVSAVNGLYVGTSGYAGLDSSVILKTSSVPENYKSTNGTIMHPFGGSLTLGPTKGNTGYYIELTDIPKSACVNLSSMNFGTSLGGVGVNTQLKAGASQDINNVTGTGKRNFTKNALTPAQASTACDQDENTIAFLLK